MCRNEAYFVSFSIETLLLKFLDLNHKRRARSDLKGLYQWIVSYENGDTNFCSKSDYRSAILKMRRYFNLAFKVCLERGAITQESYCRFEELCQLINSSEEIYDLYCGLKCIEI